MSQDKKKFRQKTGEENLDHLRYLEKMDQINRAMQGTNDLEQVMKDVLDTLLSVFDCDRAWLVYPCDPQASTWQTPMERTRPEYPGVLPIGVELPLDPVGAEVYRKLRNADGPVKFGPGSEYPVPLEIAGAFKVQSFIAMAFYPKIGKAWSFGLHQCSFARVWTPQEERLFQEIGRRLSDTLTSLLAFRNLRESEAQIRQLIDASPLPMVVSSGLEEHVEWVNDKFIELFGYTIEDMPDVEHWWPLAYPDPEYREAIKSEWEEKARKAIQDKGQIEPMEAKVTCKDGSIRFVEFQFSSIGKQHLITFVDFTERKRAEVEIQALAKFPSENPNPVLRITHDGILLYANRASAGLLRCWNCSIGKVLPRPWRKLILEALDSGLPIEKEMVCEDRVFALMLSPIVESNYVNLYGRDITERKQAEQELVVREREYRTLLKNIPDLIVRYDANLRRVYVNPAWERASGLSAAEVVNVHPADLPRVPNPIHKEYLEKLQHVLTTGTAQSIEFTWVNANGTTLFLDYVITPEYDRSGKISGVLSVGRDITERKRNEAINAARLHLIQYSLTHSLDELLEETLNEAEKLTGSLIGFYHFIDDNQKDLTLQDWSTRTKAEFCKAEGKGLHYAIDEAGVWADCVRERKAVVHNDYASLPNCKGLPEGHAVVLRELVVPVFRGEKISAILGVGNKPADYTGKDVETISHLADLAWEIAERKRAEEAQHRLNRELRAISNCNQTLMRAVDEQALLNDICRIVCDEAGYRMAWVGYPEHDEASTVRPAAWAGVEDGYLAAANITWADTERGRGPSGTAIRSGRSACIQDFATDPQAALWREAALQRGYRSNIALPLKDENANTFGALTIYSMEPNAFTLEERRLLEELAGDLAFGITVLRARAEHKRVEGQLQKSEARFRSFVEKANDIIFTVSPEGIFTYVSPNWKELLGHDASEVEGKSFESFIHPDDLILCRNVLNRAVVSGENQSGIEYRVQHKNGSWQWHTSNASVIRDPEGGIVALLGIARNITDRKHNERELILLNRAINQSSDAVFLINEQLTFAYVNDAACRSLGYTREELLTMSPSDIDAVITYDAAKEIMSKQFASGSFPRFETRHKTHDGRIFPVEISSSVVEYDGAKFSLTTVRDITERKQAEEALRESEERYRLLVNLSPDAIAIHSQWRTVFVNPAMVRISGAKNESDLIGRPVLDSVHPDFRESVKQRIEKMQSTGESIPFVEEKFLRLDGSAIHVEVAAVPYNYQGVQFVQVVTRDITARKHHEREREAIITVSNALRKATTRGGIFTVILDQLIGLFDADGAMLAMPLSTNNGTFIEAGRGAIGEKFTGLHIPHGEGVSGWVIENRKPYLNNNADQDAIFYRPDLLGDSHCVAAVPLIAQEQAIGALWIACTDSVTERDILLLNAIADIAANAIHRITLHEQTEQQLHHLTALHQIDIAISSNFDSNVTLNVILNYVKNELEVDAASILLLNPVTHDLDYAAGIGFKTRNIEKSHVKFGNEYAGRAAQEYRTVSCPDLRLVHGTFGRSTLLADEEFAAHYATPLVVKGQVKGVLELFHRKTFEPEAEWMSYFETLATQAAIAIENASLLENLQRSNMELMLAYDATIEGWSRALDLRDRETEGHTQRVTDMALKLAEKMGMSEAEKMDLRRGSLLHDIGKMGVPDSILHKPGPLSEDEINIMRQHPSYAYQMLFPISYLKHALEISYCHHEKWDGSGYPRGLKGEEIPLSARLFAVVDVFDALTSDRPYRKAWPLNDVYRYIKEQSGKHFDPQIVKIFLESRPG